MRGGRGLIEIFCEICGSHCEQFFAILDQCRQFHQLRECGQVQRSLLRIQIFRFTDDKGSDILQLVRRVVRRHEADEGFDQAIRPAVTPQQVVDVVQTFTQVVLLAPGRAARNLDDASLDEASELGAACARFEPCPIRDLLRERRLPQVGEREVDPPLLGRERFEVALEVLRVVIDQIEQVGHELVEGQSPAESGQDREQARAAAGQDLQRADRLGRLVPAGHRLPQDRAFSRVERAQGEGPEQVVHGMFRVVDLVEAAGRACEQDDPRFGLEGLPQPPSGFP